MTKQKKRLFASNKITSFHLLLFPFLFLLILICMQHKPAIGQILQDTNCRITSYTGRGDVNFKILLYEGDTNTPIDGQTIVTFMDCNAIGPENLNPAPPWGEFPYGLWRSRINIDPNIHAIEFDPNIHTINMKIYFQEETNPLNSQYWSLDYDVNGKKIVWKEFKQGYDFSSNVAEDSIRILLIDSSSLENGLGDSDPKQGVIDHVGGLLWPIPVGERCFIDYTCSYGEGSREKIFLKQTQITFKFLKSLDLFSSPMYLGAYFSHN